MKRTQPIKRPPPERVLSTAPRASRRRALVLLSIFLVSFIPGLMWFMATQPAPASDYEDYINIAAGIVVHHQFGYPEPTARRLPAYPAFLAALMWVSRSYYWIALWNIALTASIGVLVYLLARALSRGNETAAVAAGFIAAANPAFIFFSPIFATEHLFTPLLLGAFVLLVAERPRAAVRAALAGVLFGAAVLTRGEGAFYAPVAVLLIVLTARSLREKVRMSAWLTAACVIVTAPWAVRNAVVVGADLALSSYGGVNFHYAHNAEHYGWRPIEETPLRNLDEAGLDRVGYRLGLQYLREDPARLVADVARATRALYTAHDVEIVRTALWVPARVSRDGVAFRRQYPWGALGAVAYYFMGLAGCALLAAAFVRGIPSAAWLVPAGIVAANWVFYAVVYWGKPRYRFATEAFLCILAGLAVAGALHRLHARRPAVPLPARR